MSVKLCLIACGKLAKLPCERGAGTARPRNCLPLTGRGDEPSPPLGDFSNGEDWECFERT